MYKYGLRWLVALAVCFVVGCGPASGVGSGVPANPTEPTNPTPDMGPDPKGTKPKQP